MLRSVGLGPSRSESADAPHYVYREFSQGLRKGFLHACNRVTGFRDDGYVKKLQASGDLNHALDEIISFETSNAFVGAALTIAGISAEHALAAQSSSGAPPIADCTTLGT